MHVRLSYILDDHWDVEIPCSYGLIIGCGHKTSILVNECNRVYRPKMLVIFLSDFPGIYVVLMESGLNHWLSTTNMPT